MKRKAVESIEDIQEYTQYSPATPTKRQNMGASHSSLATLYSWRDWLCSLASPAPKTKTRESFSETPTPIPKAIKEEEETRSGKQPIPHTDSEWDEVNQKDGNSSPTQAICEEDTAQRGKLVIGDYDNEDDAAQAANDLWEPPELFEQVKSKNRAPSKNKQRNMATSVGSPSRTTTTTATTASPREEMGVSLSAIRQKKQPSSKTDLNDDLGRLLGKDKDEPEPLIYNPSQIKKEELVRRQEERREREAARARLAKQQRRLHRRSPRDNGRLITPLSGQWADEVERLSERLEMPDTPDPLTTTPTGTELSSRDFRTVLTGREWLNDEIVNGYLDWVVLAACEAANKEEEADGNPPSPVPKFIAHTSFFYQMMLDKGGKGTQRLMKRKKAPGDSLIEVDSIFIPINKNSHWTLGVVRPVAKTIEYIDSFNGDQGEPFRKMAREWLRDILGSKYVAADWTDLRTESAQQTNGYDCGVFVCTNALCVALGLKTDCYTQNELVEQRKVVAATLLNRGFTGDFDWDRYARL